MAATIGVKNVPNQNVSGCNVTLLMHICKLQGNLSFLLQTFSGPLRISQYRTGSTCERGSFVPVSFCILTSSLAFVPGLNCNFLTILALGDVTAALFPCLFYLHSIVLQMNRLLSGILKLFPRIGGRVHMLFWFNLFLICLFFYCCVITSRGTLWTSVTFRNWSWVYTV